MCKRSFDDGPFRLKFWLFWSCWQRKYILSISSKLKRPFWKQTTSRLVTYQYLSISKIWAKKKIYSGRWLLNFYRHLLLNQFHTKPGEVTAPYQSHINQYLLHKLWKNYGTTMGKTTCTHSKPIPQLLTGGMQLLRIFPQRWKLFKKTTTLRLSFNVLLFKSWTHC